MKNKFILGLILGIFLIGIVSAGNVIRVREGETANIDGAQISISKITGNALFSRDKNTAEIEVKMPKPVPIQTNLTNQTNCTIPWLNQTQTNNNFTISIVSSAGNVTANNSGVFIWATQKGFKYANDGKVKANLQETNSNLRKWVCNRGWLDISWLCNIN